MQNAAKRPQNVAERSKTGGRKQGGETAAKGHASGGGPGARLDDDALAGPAVWQGCAATAAAAMLEALCCRGQAAGATLR